jgi:hypothetical protein
MGWPVTKSLKDSRGNLCNEKDITYYGVLYLHYLLAGPLFFSFILLGLLKGWQSPVSLPFIVFRSGGSHICGCLGAQIQS